MIDTIATRLAEATSHRRAAEALKESEERWRSLVENSPAAIMTFDRVGTILFTNRVSPGGAIDQAVGTNVREYVLPEHVDSTIAAIEKAFGSGESSSYEVSGVGSDGRTAYYSARMGPIKSNGEIVAAIQILTDITERKKLQASIAQSDRLASMGMLAAGVAHEINNPLCYILYNLESLTDDLPRLAGAIQQCLEVVVPRVGEQEWAAAMGSHLALFSPTMLDDVSARFTDALQGTHRIKEIARGLGTFSRVEQDRLMPVNLTNVIEVAINMVFNEIKYRSRLVKEYGKISVIMANDGKLSQVFLNLLVNAAHAIEDGDVESNEIRVRTWQEGDEVFAEVRDTGKGIADEHLGQLFEPFFTTKDVGVGTGLGLSISRRIIEDYGGRIEAKSELGKGTSFVVRLPVRAAQAPDKADVPDRAVTRRDVRGRILVIDDEVGIRSAMTRMLRGHEVVEAASGDEAREILAADRAFDLVLCDMMMPRMSGMELHKWLLATDPDLAGQVVFVTGGAFTPSARDYLAEVGNIRLEKPFDVASFKTIVGELIVAYRSEQSRD